MFEKALVHFKKVDKVLYLVAQNSKPIRLQTSNDLFDSICREIIGQQLSGKVADTIYKRFIELFPHQKPTPTAISLLSADQLRNVGMSWAKVRSLLDLTDKITTYKLNINSLENLDNESIVLELTKIKGIGPWTAEMFLMFALAREDVFSPGDVGLKNAITKLYKLKEKPDENKLLAISRKWIPYRTYASIILWNFLDNNLQK
jgi:DNA-3-methyladenine glycosylase II